MASASGIALADAGERTASVTIVRGWSRRRERPFVQHDEVARLSPVRRRPRAWWALVVRAVARGLGQRPVRELVEVVTQPVGLLPLPLACTSSRPSPVESASARPSIVSQPDTPPDM